jgi:hypothetical protein
MVRGIKYMEAPATATWNLPISHSDYSKILKGWSPRDMDDKWMFCADEPDTQGNTIARICRSWTSSEQLSITIAAGDPSEIGTINASWAKITQISWVKVFAGLPVDEEEAKDMACRMCKGMLRCDLENAPSRDRPA